MRLPLRARPRTTPSALALLLAVADPAAAQITIEYIAHAAVVIEAEGVRVLIDPYNGSRWMGFDFPGEIDVDTVLITHPHYDHDAAYYVDSGVPVFREPGDYRVGGARFLGLEAEHAGAPRYRARGVTPYNVIWTVEIGGRRLTHVGDNRPLQREEIAGIGRTDVLFVPPFHAPEQALATADALGATHVVPVHYRLPTMAAADYRMPTVDDWLAGTPAQRAGSHRLRLTWNGSDSRGIVVLSPAPSVTAWTPELARAWSVFSEANGSDGAGAIEGLATAVRLAPQVMSFPLAYAEALVRQGQESEAVAVLEAALAHATEGDREPTLGARALLARLYAKRGRTAEATLLYREVLRERRTYAAEAQEEARAFLSR